LDFLSLFSEKHNISHVVEKATNCAGNAIFITDHEGIFVWVNEAFEELYAVRAKDIIGKETPRTIKSGLQTQDLYKELWETILSGKRWTGRVVNKTRNDELIDITQTITPVKELGEVTHFIAVHENYKEFKELEEKLYRQSYQLEEAQRIAHMGHWCWRVDTNTLRLSNELLHMFELGRRYKK